MLNPKKLITPLLFLLATSAHLSQAKTVIEIPTAKDLVVAPLEQALTLAQIKSSQGMDTLLITKQQQDSVTAVNLSTLLNVHPADPLDLVSQFGDQKIRELATEKAQEFKLSSLALPQGLKTKQLAAGANYAAHGEEVGGAGTFLFPKYARPTATNSQLGTKQGELLDYEIELCVRFDRDVKSMADFEAAYKGLFLCGDFTDRAVLLRLVDKDNVESGVGFTDGKSGTGRFPVAPFTVVPKDWNQFLQNVKLTLKVNGETKQDADAKMMIKKLDGILTSAFTEKDDTRWIYQEQNIPLLKDNTLFKGQSVLTGTPEGVTFRPPSKGFILTNALEWIVTGGFIQQGAVDYVVGEYIEDQLASQHYLQPGDKVAMHATYMGTLNVEIVQAK